MVDYTADTVYVNTNTVLPKDAPLGFFDDFNRPNGPLGVTWDGKTWQRFTAGAAGVSPEVQVVANAAEVIGGTGNTFVNWVAEVGSADYVIDVDILEVGSRAGGILIRCQSSNTWLVLMLRQSSSVPGMTVISSINGTRANVANSGAVPANGDHVRIIVRGDTIRVIRNGVVIINTTSAVAAGYPRAGVHADQAGLGIRYDNIRVQPL